MKMVLVGFRYGIGSKGHDFEAEPVLDGLVSSKKPNQTMVPVSYWYFEEFAIHQIIM